MPDYSLTTDQVRLVCGSLHEHFEMVCEDADSYDEDTLRAELATIIATYERFQPWEYPYRNEEGYDAFLDSLR